MSSIRDKEVTIQKALNSRPHSLTRQKWVVNGWVMNFCSLLFCTRLRLVDNENYVPVIVYQYSKAYHHDTSGLSTPERVL